MDVRFPDSARLHPSADGAHLLYKQEVQIGNRKAVVTLRFATNSGITEATAKSKMEESIAKMTALANELKLGEEGLEKIFISQGEVRGFWKEEGGDHQVEGNFVKKLQDQQKKADDGDKPGIEKQLEVIQTATEAFTQLFPLSEAAQMPAEIQFEENSPSQVSKAKTTEEIQEAFTTAQTKAKELLGKLDGSEDNKFNFIFGAYKELMGKLGNTQDLKEIETIKLELKQKLTRSKDMIERDQITLFNELLTQLDIMTTSYNEIVAEKKQLESDSPHSPEIKKLKASEGEMRSKIMEYNSKMGQRNLTTNTKTITQSHVMDFVGVVEKKLSLMEQKLQLSAPAKKSDKKKLAKIEKELQKAPTSQMIQEESRLISSTLLKLPSLVTVDQAKELHNRPNLKWGADYLNVALTTPLNWTEVQTAFIKESRAGFMHVAVTINEPLHTEEGGVPAGMLNKGDYRTKTINLFKTTSYIRSNGRRSLPQVAFRGGQFASKEAAKIALMEMIKTAPNGEVHINALLTPTVFTFLKKDRSLLAAHKKHIMEAIDELSKDPSYDKAAGKLQNQIAISNFGVNEGAVGEKNNGFLGFLKKLGLRPQFGWHTSISYSNDAAEKLNGSLDRKFNEVGNYLMTDTTHFNPLSKIDTAFLDNLGAISEVGLEMQTIWNRNAYADARVGDNQFKLPSLWKVMDELLGVRCYTNCMSGKDRTGKVQDNAQEYLDEIAMNIADHKLQLKKKFDAFQEYDPDDKWNAMEKILTSACFMPTDIDKIHRQFIEDRENLEKHIREAIKGKINNVKIALGTHDNPQLFMERKTVPTTGRGFRSGVQGISSNNKESVRAFGFATFGVTSMFAASPPSPEDAQREAYNRRLSQLSGSLKITQMNTGKPGFKVEGGKPLERFTSGFDRRYVLKKLHETHSEDEMRKGLKEWVGLDDIDPETAEAFVKKMWEAAGLNTSSDTSKAEKAWDVYLDNIEKHKMRSLFPTTKVKA